MQLTDRHGRQRAGQRGGHGPQELVFHDRHLAVRGDAGHNRLQNLRFTAGLAWASWAKAASKVSNVHCWGGTSWTWPSRSRAPAWKAR